MGIRKRAKAPRLTFAETIKQEFDYDVTGLDTYVDEQSTEILEDLVRNSGLTSRIVVMDNVKGSKEIKLKESAPTLQAASSCGWNATGGIVLTDKAISTKRVKIQEEYCNEDLNDTWAQIENAAGANVQDEEAPNFADTMIMYYQKKAAELNQNLMFNGDTGSGNASLAHYDGFVKLWDNDGDVNVYYSTETAITSTNGFDVALGLYNTIPAILFDAGVEVEILVGRETYRAIIEAVYADNNFHHTLQEEPGVEPSFILPTTNTRVRSYPQLNGTSKMYAVPYDYMFFATDLTDDMDGFRFHYNEHDEKLRFSVKFRSGIAYVFGEYFTRLRLTPAS